MRSYEAEYQWEPIEMTTDDGYTITSFIITLAFDEKMPNPPVIINHGNGWDAATWMQSLQKDGKPFPLDIVKKGFPVWLMN